MPLSATELEIYNMLHAKKNEGLEPVKPITNGRYIPSKAEYKSGISIRFSKRNKSMKKRKFLSLVLAQPELLEGVDHSALYKSAGVVLVLCIIAYAVNRVYKKLSKTK